MAFKSYAKKENMMKCVSLFLIILISMMGFPMQDVPAPDPVDSSRIAKIIKQSGNWLTIDKGWIHGVDTGMTGMLKFVIPSDYGISYSTKGFFEVKEVYESTARLYVTDIPPGTNLSDAKEVLFRDQLESRDITESPSRPPKSGEVPVPHEPVVAKPTIERYLNFQTIEYSGNGEQFRAVSSYATTVEKTVFKEKDKANYKLWVKGLSIINSDDYKREFQYGPIKFRRNLSDDKVAFKTEGFKFTEDILNETMGQVRKGNWEKGYWQKKITLDLMGKLLPKEILFHFRVYPLDNQTPKPTFIIKCISDLFYFNALTDTTGSTEKASGKLIGIIVYSPDDDRLYQVTSIFESRLNVNGEYLRMEECGYLVDTEDKEVFPFVDLRKELDLSLEPLQVKDPTTLPMWAMQATMVHRSVCAAGLSAAEMGTNPDGQISAPIEIITKNAAGIPINNEYLERISEELTKEFLAQGKDNEEAKRSAEEKVSQYNAVPPQASNAIFSDIDNLYFQDHLMQQYQLTSLNSSINDILSNAASSSVYNTNGVDCPKLESFENEPPSVNKLENSNIRPGQQTNAPAKLNEAESIKPEEAKRVKEEAQKATKEEAKKAKEKAQKARKEEAKRAKEEAKKAREEKAKKAKQQKASKARGKISIRGGAGGGGSALVGVVLGVAVAGAAVYGGLELAKALEEIDITGRWTFYINMGQYGSSSGPITLSGTKDSGTVDWGGGYTGPYSVNGDHITMRLNINISAGGCNLRLNVNISGIIQNNNSMNGSFSDSASYTCPVIGTNSITVSGSWSATR
jgi:hypothetical protein